MEILVTGGLGFIGSNFVKLLLEKKPECNITIYDAMTYAGRKENIAGCENRVKLLIKDIRNQNDIANAIKNSDIIFHLAASSHVDTSITDPQIFMETDFMGTYNILEAVRKYDKKLVHVSTSEVYGTALADAIDENHIINPQSPYAAAKAGGDRLCYAYYKTYGTKVIIIRPFNNYGPNQFPEKLIPSFITKAFYNKPLPVYGDGLYSRDWLFVGDCCAGLLAAGESEAYGESINLGTGADTDVITITRMILRHMNKPESLISFVKDRPGHVRKHVSSTEKANELLGWQAKTNFEDGLAKTVDWYMKNEWWWKPLIR